MPNMDYYNNIMLPVMQGEYDDHLDDFIQVCQDRKKAKAPSIYEFQVGQSVKFNMATNPKYLRGAQGTVKKINRTKIVIDLDHPHGRFHRNITTPLTMVERV